jgi:hypothetical protein
MIPITGSEVQTPSATIGELHSYCCKLQEEKIIRIQILEIHVHYIGPLLSRSLYVWFFWRTNGYKSLSTSEERERERERRDTHSSLALQLRGKTVLCSEEGDWEKILVYKVFFRACVRACDDDENSAARRPWWQSEEAARTAPVKDGCGFRVFPFRSPPRPHQCIFQVESTTNQAPRVWRKRPSITGLRNHRFSHESRSFPIQPVTQHMKLIFEKKRNSNFPPAVLRLKSFRFLQVAKFG